MSSMKEQLESQRDISLRAKIYMTEEKEEKRNEVVGGGMKVEGSSNLELTLMSAASSVKVERRRRLIDSEMSAMSRTSNLLDLIALKDVFYTRSLDHIPPFRAERDDYVGSALSQTAQPQPQLEKSLLAKNYVTDEKEGKGTEVIGADISSTKVESASNLELTLMTAAESLKVERRRRFSDSEMSLQSRTSRKRLAGPTSHQSVFYTKSLDRIPQYRAARDEYDQIMSTMKEQLESRKNTSLLATEEQQRKPINPVEAELPEMKDKSASNPDLTQTSAALTPAVERRSKFIKVKKSTMLRTPATRLGGFPSHKSVFRTRSLRRIPQYRAERDDYVSSTASLTAQRELQSDQSWVETIGVTNEQKGNPTNVLESGLQTRMKFKSASALDLKQMYAAPSSRRRRLSESEKSTKSIKSTKSTISRASFKHLVDRMTQPELFHAISLEHISQYRVDREDDYSSVTSLEPQSDKIWLEKIGNTKKPRQRMSEMMILRLFRDSVFVLFAVSVLLTGIGFVVPYVFLPNRGLRLGFESSQSSWLISVVGISNTVGRFAFGFIASMKRVNALVLYSTMLIMCGICSVLSVLLTTFPLQMCYALCFGFLSSVYMSLKPVVLVDLFGLQKLSSAFGVIMLFQGIGALAGPPLAGWLYDASNNYDNSFYMMGICFAVSGVMLFPILCIQRRRLSHIYKETETQSV